MKSTKPILKIILLAALATSYLPILSHCLAAPSDISQQQAAALKRVRRAATARLDRLWDDAVIPYEIDPIFSEERAALFRSAMRHWENYTCIKFVERQPEVHRNYIVFTERSCGCCSFVGKRGNGAQAISIGKHCDKFGIVVHELGHVVGFWHEHTRPDRDQHVQIISKNIMTGQEYNFNKLTKDEVNSLGLAYDYDSILHYATNTFAKDTYLDTILPLHGHLNTEEATTGAPNNLLIGIHQHSTNTNSSSSMINEAEATYAQLQRDFQSMLQYNVNNFKIRPVEGKHAINGSGQPLKYEARQRQRRDTLNKMDVDSGEHMLSMDNLLAKTRPEIGQRVRLSVGDIAQTNLLYKCPKCGATIQQSSGIIYSPNYFNDNYQSGINQRVHPNQEVLDFCEWRITAGQGERIMLNLSDLDLAPPSLAQTIRSHQRIGLPKQTIETPPFTDSMIESQPSYYAKSMINNQCHLDYLEVRDGYNYRAPLIAKVCGHISSLRDTLRPIVSTSNRLLVSYKISSASSTKRGFTIQHETICGGYIMLNKPSQVNEPQQILYNAPSQTPLTSSINPFTTDRKVSAVTTGFQLKQTTVASSISAKPIVSNQANENEVLLNSQINSRLLNPHSHQSLKPQNFMQIETINSEVPPILTVDPNSRHDNRSNSSNNSQLRSFGWAQWPAVISNLVSSPNYPDQYRSGKECIWRIDAGENHQVLLRFDAFDLESHDSCAYDYVEVHDGDSIDGNMVGRFCGNRIPDQILSSSQSLMLKFVSDSDVNRQGFLAILQPELDECKLGSHGCAYKCSNAALPYRCECPNGLELAQDGRNCVPACGGIRNETSGVIVSPSFPGLYPITTKCHWTIMAPLNYRITMNFTHFDLEGVKGQDCDYDYVDISSRLNDGRYSKNGSFCGTMDSFTVTSESNVLQVDFVSDNSIQKTGFRANFFIDKDECATNNGGCHHTCTDELGSYRCSCNNGFILHDNKHDCIDGPCMYSISIPEGIFQSTNFPNSYPPNKECAWLFSTALGHRIKINFDLFELESHQECIYDNIAVYDGESSSDQSLGRFCGVRRQMPPLVSSSNMLYLLFKSDGSNERRGFNGTHSTVCGGRLQANLDQKDRIFSHPQFDGLTSYNRNEDCEWLIEGNMNQRVRIEFNFFSLEPDNNCNYDQVNVYDGPDDTSVQMAHLCGTEITKEHSRLTSSGDSMFVVFKSDDSINNRGFVLTYTAIQMVEDEKVAITMPTNNKYASFT